MILQLTKKADQKTLMINIANVTLEEIDDGTRVHTNFGMVFDVTESLSQIKYIIAQGMAAISHRETHSRAIIS